MMEASPRNTYYICNRESKTSPLNLFQSCPDPESKPWFYARTAYMCGVFRAMEEYLSRGGLIFYLTQNLHQLPSYGSNVIAVIQEDEFSRFPAYSHKVLATFKCYGTEQVSPPNLFIDFSYLSLLTNIKYCVDMTRRFPGQVKYVCRQLRQNSFIFSIPLGYATQLSLPIKPFEEREMDLFFAGSVKHRDSSWIQRWLTTPKELSRGMMIFGLENAQRELTELKVDLQLQQNFRSSITSPAARYSESMMNAKICLVPRGASYETYRYFEAMRYGCITISETLPPRWFYEGSPSIQVKDWSDLPNILNSLLEDRSRMLKLHKASLEWWKNFASEEALGQYFAEKLNALLM